MPATGVTQYEIHRGRSHELDKTQAGRATINIIDLDGSYDPTNTSSPLYGAWDTMSQAAIGMKNPVDNSVSTIFQGHVANMDYDLDVSEKFANVTIELVDAFDLFARTPMASPRFGDNATGDIPGLAEYKTYDVYFKGAGGQYFGTDDHWGPGANSFHPGRINRILDQYGWPSGRRIVFSGNVALQEVIYDRGTAMLEALYDCADAEFPGVANIFMSKDGKFIFHGRHARFNPSAYSTYGINEWFAGDLSFSSVNAAYAPIAGLKLSRGYENLINEVWALPQGIDETDVPNQVYRNTTSINKYGLFAEDFKDLLVYKGEKLPRNNALQETHLFAQYYVDNYKDPQDRISEIVFKVKQPTHFNALALWNLICGVEISDVIYVYTTHTAGGGIAEGYFVEGIHYIVKPMKKNHPEVELRLDLSPIIYYASNPF